MNAAVLSRQLIRGGLELATDPKKRWAQLGHFTENATFQVLRGSLPTRIGAVSKNAQTKNRPAEML